MTRTCSRCGDEFEEPSEEANYVRSSDFEEEVETEKRVVLKHTDKTREIRDRLVDDQNLNAEQANRVMARGDENYLRNTDDEGRVKYDHTDIGDSDFEEVESDEPLSPEQDPEVIRTDRRVETEPQVKTGLVCKDTCSKDDDEQLWS